MPDQDQKPSILNRLITPTGSLPKNFQSWLLVGVAVLMALVIAFSSRAAPGPKPPTTKTPVAAQVTDVNTAQIIESKVRLEEAVRQLETEKAKLAQIGAQANGPALPETMPTYVASNGGGYNSPAYDRAATNFASCQFIAALGSGTVHPAAAAVQRLHDDFCHATVTWLSPGTRKK